MRKLFTSILAAMLIACGLFFTVSCSSGCKSTARTTYVSSGVTHVTVKSALAGWNAYLGAKDAELNALAATDAPKAVAERKKIALENARVEDAYRKYQASQIALLTAAQEFSKIPADDPDAPASADRLNAAVAAATKTMASVLDLLAEFGIKPAK